MLDYWASHLEFVCSTAKGLGKCRKRDGKEGNSLPVQWLGLCTFTAKGTGPIPGWGTKSPQAARYGQKNFKIEYIHTYKIKRERDGKEEKVKD